MQYHQLGMDEGRYDDDDVDSGSIMQLLDFYGSGGIEISSDTWIACAPC